MVNIFGLSIGVAASLLIGLYIIHELSYDKFFSGHQQIFKVSLERIYPNHSTYYAVIPHSFAQVAAEDINDIDMATLAMNITNVTFTYIPEDGEVRKFDEPQLLAADSLFLSVFDFEIKKGVREKALTSGNQIVITEDFAERYFGDIDPIGKILSTQGQDFLVSAVMQDVPENSHFRFSALISPYNIPNFNRENFTGFSSYVYIKLKDGADPENVEHQWKSLVDRYAAAQIERELGKSWSEYQQAGNGYRYFLQQLKDIHLFPQYLEVQLKPSGNINSILALLAIAVLIIVIACINFMNLSTAKSFERAKEVGIRKVLGSLRKQLIGQFLTEALILSSIGVLIAVLISAICFGYFNSLIGRNLSFPLDPNWLLALLALIITVGLLAGLYPSFILSSHKPVEVLKGKYSGSTKGNWVRNGLVVFQFWISIVLIIGTLVIQDQMKFMQEFSLGFDKEQVLVIDRGFDIGQANLNTLLSEIKSIPGVVNAAGTFALPGREGSFFGAQFRPIGSDEILTTKSMVVFDDLPETLGLRLLEGRKFSESTNDSLHVMLNETAVQAMGIADPIGSRLVHFIEIAGESVEVVYTVIGIVQDFNFISLRDNITPLVIQSNEAFGGGLGQYAVARIDQSNSNEVIQSISEKWNAIVPEEPFQYSFLDEQLDEQYRSEQQTATLFSTFAVLAIFISCVGLFSLSAYVTQLRTKEIGVRKVLGASVLSIILMLNKEFSKMVITAFVFAVPIAWYMVEKWWLQNFAFSVGVKIFSFLWAGILVMLIAWFTISFQSFKAAVSNPIKAIKAD